MLSVTPDVAPRNCHPSLVAHYRGNPDEESAMGRWYRRRWKYGSVFVGDIDRIICPYSADVGFYAEEKHTSAESKTWNVTKIAAARGGYYGARFIYDTDDDTPNGNVIDIPEATILRPDGSVLRHGPLDIPWFDDWVCRVLGARPNDKAA